MCVDSCSNPGLVADPLSTYSIVQTLAERESLRAESGKEGEDGAELPLGALQLLMLVVVVLLMMMLLLLLLLVLLELLLTPHYPLRTIGAAVAATIMRNTPSFIELSGPRPLLSAARGVTVQMEGFCKALKVRTIDSCRLLSIRLASRHPLCIISRGCEPVVHRCRVHDRSRTARCSVGGGVGGVRRGPRAQLY